MHADLISAAPQVITMVDECNTLSDEELLERGDQAGQSQEARVNEAGQMEQKWDNF